MPENNQNEKQEEFEINKLKKVEDKYKKQFEDEKFQQQITERVTEAEKMIRAYELQIKKGDFDIEPPYQNALDIYKSIRKQLLDRNWNDQANIYLNQIKLVQEKIRQDERLREIEAKKREKDAAYLEAMKLSERKRSDYKKLKAADDKIKRELEDEIFQRQINEQVSEANKLIRTYEVEIKKGNFDVEPPYQNVIEIYEEIRKELLDREWNEQANTYLNQINLFREKDEKDKLLREIESRKKEKEETHLKVMKLGERKKSEYKKISAAQEKLKKEADDAKFQQTIDNMVSEAESLERDYNLAIKKGDFEKVPPFERMIEIYESIREMLIEKEWKDQSVVFQKQIQLVKERWESDKILRDLEARKKEKDKKYLESLKIKEEETIDAKKLKTIEDLQMKKLEDKKFEENISRLASEADEMIRKYEREIRKGNFGEQCVYPEVIGIYEKIRDMLIERGWIDESKVYIKQINLYRQKLENDERLREIETQKIKKQMEYEEALKVKAEDTQIREDLAKIKEVEEQYQKDLEEEDFENRIVSMVDEAEKLVKRYELSLRKGKFDEKCVYPEVINIYRNVQNLLNEKGWSEEARLYNSQINLYQQKLEQDQRLRLIEESKAKKQKEFEEQFLLKKKEDSLEMDAERIKAVEEQYQRELEKANFEREISKLVDHAEEMARKYEFAIRQGKFEKVCPYPEIIDIYKDIHKKLLDKGWTSEAMMYNNQIKFYKEKQRSDEKLREMEAQKELKWKEMEEMLKAKKVVFTADLEKMRETEAKRKEKELLFDEGFNLIDRAEKLVKDYELKLKLEKDILLYESPYEKVISLYRQARKIFQDNGWDNEANRLINTINFYKDKQEKDEKLKALERKKLEEAEAKISIIRPRVDRALTERKKRALAIEEEKRKQEELSSEAFRIIDEAEKLAKRYELELKEAMFSEPPFERIIKMYRNARSMFEEIGWEDQAGGIINTINYYKEKMQADSKLRTLEAKKIEIQKKEMEEQQRVLKRLREKERKQLKLRQETLLLKSEQEKQLEEKKFKAFSFMDQAKRQLDQDNFDFAIDLYKESEIIFSEINWPEGLKMVQESIFVIKKKKQEYELRKKAIEEEEAEKLQIEKELEEEITKTKELERLQQELKREEMLKIQKQKEKEIQSSERAYSLLEEGTSLLEKNKFKEAHEKYIAAQDIFKELDWYHEVNRINNDLLVNLQIEQTKQIRLEEYKKKKLEEKQELKYMLLEAEKQRKELEGAKIKEKRERLLKLRVSDKLKDRIEENLERANIEIQNARYNKGVLKLKEVIKMMERIGWDKEIAEVNSQIHILNNKTHVPLIVLEEIDKGENMDKFKSAYGALDKAQVSLLKNRLMKAISELNEAKFNLTETKIGVKFIEQIETKIKELREDIDKKRKLKDVSDIEGIEIEEGEPLELSSELAYEYMDKCKKEERRNNFKKAIEYATTAKEIFVKLGSEWAREIMSITRYISTLENKQIVREESFKRRKEEIEKKERSLKEEEDEFKKRIASRREERRKRIRELMEKK